MPTTLPSVVAQTPPPTSPPTTPETGMGLALAYLGFVVVAVGVLVGLAFLVAAWATLRGSLFTRVMTRRQRQVFAVSTVCFPASVLAYFLHLGPAALVAGLLGVLALVAGVGWLLAAALWDWLESCVWPRLGPSHPPYV